MDDLLNDLPLKAPSTRGIPRSAASKTLKAQWMRQNPTKGEAAFKLLITHLKIDMEFAPQAQVAGYILDFYHCGLRKDGQRCQPFCVEIDGTSHVGEKARKRDQVRTAALSRMGIRVIRFWNGQVVSERDRVALAIMKMREPLE